MADIGSLAYGWFLNFMTGSLFNKRASMGLLLELPQIFDASVELFVPPLIASPLPWARWLGVGGVRKKMKVQAQLMGQSFGKW